MLKMRPSWMPYELPSVHTALEKQSPGAVGTTRLRMASAIDTAVLAALLRPHFLMSAPPRPATVGVNSSLNHFMSCRVVCVCVCRVCVCVCVSCVV
jgi:hypothetical protein